MRTSFCRQDSLHKILRDRDGSFAYLTPVNKFGSCSCDGAKSELNRRTHVDEARRACTEYGIGLAPVPSCGLRANSVKACALSVRKLVPGVPSGEHPWPFLRWCPKFVTRRTYTYKKHNTPQSYVHWRVRICSRRPARAGSDAHGSGSFDANAVLHASLKRTLVTTQQLGNKKNFTKSRHLKDAFDHRKKNCKAKKTRNQVALLRAKRQRAQHKWKPQAPQTATKEWSSMTSAQTTATQRKSSLST